MVGHARCPHVCCADHLVVQPSSIAPSSCRPPLTVLDMLISACKIDDDDDNCVQLQVETQMCTRVDQMQSGERLSRTNESTSCGDTQRSAPPPLFGRGRTMHLVQKTTAVSVHNA
jgi:hypothetical protein